MIIENLLLRSNSNDRLILNTLLSLSNVYQRLETHKLFHKSPQKVHISFTISKIFEMLPTADKGLIYKQFNVENDDNVGLWSSLGVCYLPEDSRKNAEAFVFDKLKKTYENCFGSTITENGLADLAKVTRLAGTCSFVGHDNALEKYLIQAWDKTSLNKVVSSKDNCVTKTELNGLEYLESLVSLTKSVKCELWNYSNIEQITRSISSILHLSNTEETILLFELFCFLTVKGRRDQNKHIVDTIYSDTLKSLIQRAEPFLRYKIFRNMANHDYCKQEYKVIFKGIDDNGLLDKEWRIYCNLINKPNSIEWKQKLLQVENNTFRHKCIKTSFHKLIKEGSMQSTQSNFDLGDTLFGDDSDSDEPLSKKVKLDQSEMSNLIARMENDTSLLCKLKGTLLSEEHKKRITNMCDKLKNIFS